MDTKPLLYGLIGFFIGGLTVAVAATTFDKPADRQVANGAVSMDHGTELLRTKTGDDFDEAFIAEMITHHQSAVDMAKLAADKAKHDELKQLSNDITATQKKEIDQMRQWQNDWGYDAAIKSHGGTGH